jgi:flagellar hook-basal body complex protein FliE
MTIPAIGPISPVNAGATVDPTSSVSASTGSGASGFATALTGAVDNLQQLQSTSDSLNIQAVTGNLDDIQQATIASARVETTVQLVSAVRNQAVDAFNDIMKMDA